MLVGWRRFTRNIDTGCDGPSNGLVQHGSMLLRLSEMPMERMEFREGRVELVATMDAMFPV